MVTNDPRWVEWSERQLDKLALRHRLIINPVVYAELSIGFQQMDEVETILSMVKVQVEEMPRGALFLARKAFQKYRARAGTKTGVLPDFFIGVHVVTAGVSVLTRDARRYRSYFPKIRLITPGDA